jgi:hypothetical protein
MEKNTKSKSSQLPLYKKISTQSGKKNSKLQKSMFQFFFNLTTKKRWIKGEFTGKTLFTGNFKGNYKIPV